MRLVDIFLEFIDKMIIFVGNNIFQFIYEIIK